MTITVPATSEDTNLDAACTAVAAEVARTDGKASLFSEPSTGSVYQRLTQCDGRPSEPLLRAGSSTAARGKEIALPGSV
jgi:hypothetical protein